ncbi:hypothetical protein CRUP_018395, partial [Coryphaenoides rupestris]
NLPQAFGIPLVAVITNDRAYKKRLESGHQQRRREREEEEVEEEEEEDGEEEESRFKDGGGRGGGSSSSSSRRGNNRELSSSNSSLSSTCDTPTELTSPPPAPPQPPGMPEAGQTRTHRRSRLLEALQLSLPVESPSNRKKHKRDKKLSLNPIYQQVPRVLDCCCQHLEKYGLQTVGIFRVGSSRKRVKQLREEFDQGMEEVSLDEEQSVHDVAALLKEFLRDLPDPLLTRELYTAFINSIDTLQRLLHFLSTVAAHADDRLAGNGAEITAGNKMTALNLATIFGPNLLHKQKNSDKEFAVQSFARAEESTAIIGVVQSMISNYQTLFMVPCDLQNEVLMNVLETDTDVVDYLLRRKDSQYSSSSLLRPAAGTADDDEDDDDSYPLSDRRSSCESHHQRGGGGGDSSSGGEVSPYDNNSPVLSDRPASRSQGPGPALSPLSDSLFKPSSGGGGHGGRPSGDGERGRSLFSAEEAPDEHFWGKWHTLLSQELRDTHLMGSHGDVSMECQSGDRLPRRRGNNGDATTATVKRTQSSALAAASDRPRLPLTRCSSSSPSDRRRGGRGQAQSPTPLARRHGACDQSAATTTTPATVTTRSEDSTSAAAAARADAPAGGCCCRLKGGEAMDGAAATAVPSSSPLPEPLKGDGHISHSPASLSTSVPSPGERSSPPPSPPPPPPPHCPPPSPPPKPPLTPGEVKGALLGSLEGQGERESSVTQPPELSAR